MKIFWENILQVDLREEQEENSHFSLCVPSFPKHFWMVQREEQKNPKFWIFSAFPYRNGTGNGWDEDPAPSPCGNEGFAGVRSWEFPNSCGIFGILCLGLAPEMFCVFQVFPGKHPSLCRDYFRDKSLSLLG